MSQEELNRLIDEALDGVISEADFLRLEAELLENPTARQLYYERLKLHTSLQQAAIDESGAGADKAQNLVEVSLGLWRRHWTLIAAAAAAVMLALVIGGQVSSWNSPDLVQEVEPVAAGYGVVAEESDAVWKNGAGPMRGELLPAGVLGLESGTVQLEFFSGVTVILEGEAEFEVLSTMEMSLSKGQMRAMVPEPARGFKVRTSTGDIVDLGTEFVVDVADGHSDLHVVEGEVEWHPESQSHQKLVTGDSLRWTDQGIQAEAAILDSFPGLTDLQARRELRRQKQEEQSKQLRQDPRLLAYYPMDQPGSWDRMLMDESGKGRHGAIVRAERVPDRWGQPNAALDFSPMGSRVRLAIPGEHDALTLYCWVRIDSLDRWYNSLFLTDGHELNEPHWQLLDDGQLFFSVKQNEKPGGPAKHNSLSPVIWTPTQSGRWVQLAAVYDAGAGTTTHYVNGEAVLVDKLPAHLVADKVHIGAASIGNWSEPNRNDPEFAIRNLNGSIDEFAIFSAALSTEEIRSLYEVGKP